jgi:predicted GIY-YIG superfamily endonuclease
MRVAEITTRIVRVVEVPRSQLGEFLRMPEALQVGVYFLIGELSESGLPRVYIGQSGNVGKRLVQHNQDTDRGKDFWNRALVVVSLTNSMTQTHALFLEWFAIGQATQAGRYSLENGNAGARPHTSAPLEADCHEIHETAATLLATLGQPIFEPLTNAASSTGDKELFYCKGSGADGVGEYTTEGFVVHQGSQARLDSVASIQPSLSAHTPATGRRGHHGRAGRRVCLYPRPPVRQPQHGRGGADGPLGQRLGRMEDRVRPDAG